jgi:hypothetical protein
MKGVGEPCAGEPHARFDAAAGGAARPVGQAARLPTPPADPSDVRGKPRINAHAETLDQKPVYRRLIGRSSSRCLVLADGWLRAAAAGGSSPAEAAAVLLARRRPGFRVEPEWKHPLRLARSAFQPYRTDPFVAMTSGLVMRAAR